MDLSCSSLQCCMSDLPTLASSSNASYSFAYMPVLVHDALGFQKTQSARNLVLDSTQTHEGWARILGRKHKEKSWDTCKT